MESSRVCGRGKSVESSGVRVLKVLGKFGVCGRGKCMESSGVV